MNTPSPREQFSTLVLWEPPSLGTSQTLECVDKGATDRDRTSALSDLFLPSSLSLFPIPSRMDSLQECADLLRGVSKLE